MHSKDFSYSFAGEKFAELGCAHSTQPWTLSICNSLLSGRVKQARALLEVLEMDGGIACEAFDAKTGKPFSGSAFATCAGFLAYAMHKAFSRTEARTRRRHQPQPAPQPSGAGSSAVKAAQDPPAVAAPKPQSTLRRPAPIGSVLRDGKRSTKGVAALVPNEPVRPLKPKKR